MGNVKGDFCFSVAGAFFGALGGFEEALHHPGAFTAGWGPPLLFFDGLLKKKGFGQICDAHCATTCARCRFFHFLTRVRGCKSPDLAKYFGACECL